MSDYVRDDSVEVKIVLFINDLFDDFNRSGLTVSSQAEYALIIATLVNEIFEDFGAWFKRIKGRQKFKNIYLGVLRAKQDAMFNDQRFISVTSGVRDIDDELNISQPYFEAILVYCRRSGRDDKNEVISYLIRLNALLQVFHKINNYKLPVEPGNQGPNSY